MSVPLVARFQGCLLGVAVADALGGRFEAQDPEHVQARFPDVQALLDDPKDELWYTDDAQMTIGVAECLADHGRIIEEPLCRAFVANYVPSRGYGRGARVVLDAMEEGRDYQAVAERYFPGGSFGNGAAMRVAPVGLLFRDDHAALWEQTRLSALPTHRHPLGIEGAQLLALAVAWATAEDDWDRKAFLNRLIDAATLPEYRTKLQQALVITSPDELAALGNGIAAIDSVPTAIAAFALTPDSYAETVFHAIRLGGDTDTIAAMAGALAGARLGVHGIPSRWLDLLEESPKGKSYLFQLAERLYQRSTGART